MTGNMAFSIEIHGAKEIAAKYDTAAPIVKFHLRRAMTRAVTGELGRVPPYPPAPAGSTRTGYLGRSLASLIGSAPDATSDIREQGNNMVGIVGTAVKYAPRVIGESSSKPWSGYWWRLPSIVMSHQSQIEAEFRQAGDDIAAALGV